MKQLLVLFLCTMVLVGCTKQPTEFTSVVDDSPTASFNVPDSSDLTLWVDGISYGKLALYEYPSRALKLIPGQHVIEVRRDQQVIFKEKHYFSEATHRTIDIK